MSYQIYTRTYSPQEQEQLQVVRAGLLEAYRHRQLTPLARRIGLPPTTVHRIWRGDSPQHATLAALYEALKP